MDKKFVQKIVLFVAILAGFFLFYQGLIPENRTVLLNQTAPPIFGKAFLADHKDFKSQSIIGQKVLLVNFWATWCGPCREEVPILNQYFKALDPQKFQMVSFMEDEVEDKKDAIEIWKQFNASVPIEFPVYLDPDAKAAFAFGTRQIPETFVIDKQGKVVLVRRGPIEKGEADLLLKEIKGLL